eukprot:244436_1
MSEIKDPIDDTTIEENPQNDMMNKENENDDKQYASESETILKDMKELDIEKKKIEQEEEKEEINSKRINSENNNNMNVEITCKPTVIEDFIRNFLISNEMH